MSVEEGTVGIGNSAFYDCGTFTSVSLPDSVRAIGDYAFTMTSLVTALLGDGVERIGELAFSYCQYLSTVSLGSNLRSIGDYAFDNCTRLSSISIPDTVEYIGTYAFHNTGFWNSASDLVYADNWVVGCKNMFLMNAFIRAGTVGISKYAFYNCFMLSDLTIPDTVRVIDREAFVGCGIESVTIAEGATEIADYVFYQLFVVGEYHVAGYIGTDRPICILRMYGFDEHFNPGQCNGNKSVCFLWMYGVTEIVIPDSVQVVGNNAFSGCTALMQCHHRRRGYALAIGSFGSAACSQTLQSAAK